MSAERQEHAIQRNQLLWARQATVRRKIQARATAQPAIAASMLERPILRQTPTLRLTENSALITQIHQALIMLLPRDRGKKLILPLTLLTLIRIPDFLPALMMLMIPEGLEQKFPDLPALATPRHLLLLQSAAQALVKPKIQVLALRQLAAAV